MDSEKRGCSRAVFVALPRTVHFRRSAKQLGHSVQIAERHYCGLVEVPIEAKTLEDAMQVSDLLEEALARLSGFSGERQPEVALRAAVGS